MTWNSSLIRPSVSMPNREEGKFLKIRRDGSLPQQAIIIISHFYLGHHSLFKKKKNRLVFTVQSEPQQALKQPQATYFIRLHMFCSLALRFRQK